MGAQQAERGPTPKAGGSLGAGSPYPRLLLCTGLAWSGTSSHPLGSWWPGAWMRVRQSSLSWWHPECSKVKFWGLRDVGALSSFWLQSPHLPRESQPE